MDDCQVAWVAGLFEGEGTFFVTGPERVFRGVRLSMTDRDVIDKLQRIVGGGKIYAEEARGGVENPHYKTYYRWCLNRRDECEILIRAMLPHLGKRRSKAAHAALLSIEEQNKYTRRLVLGGFCQRGHLLTEKTLASDSRQRSCRTCTNERNRARRAAKK